MKKLTSTHCRRRRGRPFPAFLVTVTIVFGWFGCSGDDGPTARPAAAVTGTSGTGGASSASGMTSGQGATTGVGSANGGAGGTQATATSTGSMGQGGAGGVLLNCEGVFEAKCGFCMEQLCCHEISACVNAAGCIECLKNAQCDDPNAKNLAQVVLACGQQSCGDFCFALQTAATTGVGGMGGAGGMAAAGGAGGTAGAGGN